MLLEVRHLGKRFDGVRALDGVDLSVVAGSVHGLLGENGAGKSTLIKTLSGLVTPDSGEIRVDGALRGIAGVREAEALGFRFIHQELSLVPHFTAVENCFVGRPYPRRGPVIDRAAMRARVEPAARLVAPDLPLDLPAGRMTTGQKQLVEIVRALMTDGARLIVMDEPTASLSDGEAERLHRAVRALAAQGVAVIFISHRLDEVLAICDRYTVLRNGRTTGTGGIVGTTRADLIRLMSGHEERRPAPSAPVAPGRPVLELSDLPFGPSGGSVSLTVREGEIVGLYGLVGAGRSSLLKLVWGARHHAGGRIRIDDVELAPGRIDRRIAAGAAYVPEDRRGEGLVTQRSIADNLAIADLSAVRTHARLPVASARMLSARAMAIRDQLSIKMASPWAKPLTLSGGNQQKLLFGRWSGRKIRLLILDEPSRGVDVGAKAEIHAIVRQLAAQGAAVLMATSDMDELLALSSRVLVMAGGVMTAELAGDDIVPKTIVAAAFAHSDRKEQR
ncbi:sugar ABC transporter ATP-binding protein [Kumtagia ephedrae]|uniref:Sugar ABC transporter ATP-binding protein n=1 Tax=Kumtagia ephedrae TaxID=2116701 RepID=A0A2P7S2S1_9HYPH|nr:sugar ABC transporter ATP-binding protein [Mesorhizobium ephedrae]PSJ56770.1 sugar ABC transporter ATP-binding protein [Mesorhizobium ephedrae]